MDIEKYEKKIFELQQLLEVTKALNSTLNFRKLVDAILFSFMAQARCTKAALYIGQEIEPDIITLQRNYMGFEIDPVIPIQLSCEIPALKTMMENDRCLTIDEFSNYLPHNSQTEPLISYLKKELELIIPLSINKKLVGIVLLGGRIDSFPITKHEIEFLGQIGLYSSIAIQNSLLFDMATMDMMTGLKVKHFLTKLIDESIKVGEHNFIIIMMDIDDFKSVNDTYGHQIGDETIIGVANIMKQAVRDNDVASRYGGEEFVVMLRETDLEAGIVVAERIRAAVENMKISSGKTTLSTTISLGVAEFDIDIDKNTHDIIGRADNSLYISKRNGKNQVTTA
ncbi:MAG: hypothetical protein B6229_07025 [Spirochaetaceae bacterium 4572_7]|nr:MAG: hypothetical protein B6229_07025 [Spirochaetaceae bacterium 4572_7]